MNQETLNEKSLTGAPAMVNDAALEKLECHVERLIQGVENGENLGRLAEVVFQDFEALTSTKNKHGEYSHGQADC